MSFQQRERESRIKGDGSAWLQLHKCSVVFLWKTVSISSRGSRLVKMQPCHACLVTPSLLCSLRAKMNTGTWRMQTQGRAGHWEPRPGTGLHSRELGVDVLQVPAEGLAVQFLPLLDPCGHTEVKNKAGKWPRCGEAAPHWGANRGRLVTPSHLSQY